MEPPGMHRVTQIAAEVLRPPLRLSAEDLVASELASTIATDPLNKIRHACEALMALNEHEKKTAGITDEEEQTAYQMYSLVLALQRPVVDKFTDSHGNVIERAATIAWPFGREEAPLWLNWAKNLPCRYYAKTPGERDAMEQKMKEIEILSVRKYVMTSSKITLDSLSRFQHRFCVEFMPVTVTIIKKIMKLISPDSFNEAVKSIWGRKFAGSKGKTEDGTGMASRTQTY